MRWSSRWSSGLMEACDLVPFRAGIDEGRDMIMTAHIQYPQIEKETYVSILDGKEICLPATLSHTIITGLLRKQMGYDGIVITDAMGMEAIASHFDPVDAAVLAINAGVDILLCPLDLYKDEEINTFPAMDAYMKGILARVESGEISEEELDDSVYRILKLKMERGIYTDSEQTPVEEQTAQAEATVGTAEHHAREWEIAQAGMTLLKNEGNALPLDGKRSVLILSQSVTRNEEIVKVIERVHEDGRQAVLLCLNLPYRTPV